MLEAFPVKIFDLVKSLLDFEVSFIFDIGEDELEQALFLFIEELPFFFGHMFVLL